MLRLPPTLGNSGTVIEELVGSLPDGWVYTTLASACARGGGDIQTGPFGSQLHAADYVIDGVPSIMPQNIGDNRIVEDGIARITPQDAKRLGRYLVRTGDIVYSRRGDVERRALVREHEDGWLCGTGCLRVRFGSGGVDSRFASYYLGHSSVREWITRHAHGATMPNLNTSILGACPFVVPVLDDQRAIAHILGTLDDKIELNLRMSETLESMARALFKSWFVDFEPVSARAEAKHIGLPTSFVDLFPARFVDSELGEIPEGWVAGTVGSFSTPLSGGTPSKKDSTLWGLDIPWVTPKAMTSMHVDDADEYVTTRALGNGTRLAPRNSTLVMVRGMGLHEKVRVSQARRDVAFNQDVKALVPLGIDATLLLFALLNAQETLLRRVESSGHGTGRLPTDLLMAYPVTMPQESLQDRLATVLRPINDRIASASDESRALTTLRDALLPKLISGELRVKDAATFMASAT
jgi:type I restriction enzyme, S subunit